MGERTWGTSSLLALSLRRLLLGPSGFGLWEEGTKISMAGTAHSDLKSCGLGRYQSCSFGGRVALWSVSQRLPLSQPLLQISGLRQHFFPLLAASEVPSVPGFPPVRVALSYRQPRMAHIWAPGNRTRAPTPCWGAACALLRTSAVPPHSNPGM